MLTSIRIQNFRSIRDASVKLGQVNLFIGPNNSGKSNFLKGIEVFANYIYNFPVNQDVYPEWYEQNISRNIIFNPFEPIDIKAELRNRLSDEKYCEVFYNLSWPHALENNNNLHSIKVYYINNENKLNLRQELEMSNANMKFVGYPSPFYYTRENLKNIVLYKVEPAAFEFSSPLSHQPSLKPNASNIANFLNTLSQNDDGRFNNLKKDFGRCIETFVSISTPPDPEVSGNLKIKFFDINRKWYWAEEVSEGVLYFLALLCIVHQDSPPNILLLEEPEKGIHPRRIREVMGFIFELARLRDIQIILTSHSPYIVDYFADIPECISVFDRENGETVIRNAAELIEQTNKEYAEQGLPPVNYRDSLGEYWLSGFLGGVPA